MNATDYLSAGALALGVFALLSIVYYSLRSGSPPTPSPDRALRRALEALSREPLPDGAIYEPGSGWGGAARALAKQFPDRDVVGVELSLAPFLWSAFVNRVAPLENLAFFRADFFDVSFENAAAVFCYLRGKTMTALADKFAEELPPGALALTLVFAIRDRAPVQTLRADDFFKSEIFLYRY
jgi:cyclopropane fatty-acyl-phospholipid synthase-like methyltransferase